MAIEDAIPYELPGNRDAQLRHDVENYDERADAQWELEMGMEPDANWPGDVAQIHDNDDRSPSPETAAGIRSPSVEITGHRRSPSVEIMDRSPAPPIRINDPPVLGPSGSNYPSHLIATPEEVDRWAASAREESELPLRGVHTSIRATSAQAVAQTYIAVLANILGDADLTSPPFQVADGTTYCNKNVRVASFARDDCHFRV